MKKAILVLLLLLSLIPVCCYSMSVEEAEEIVGINISTANASTLKEYITQLDIGLSLSIDEAGVRALFDMKDAASERLIAMGECEWLFNHVMETNFDLEKLTNAELVVMRDYLNGLIDGKGEPKSNSVTVPAGLWVVGEDIPAGMWEIHARPDDYTIVIVGNELNGAGTSVTLFGDVYISEYLTGEDNWMYDKGDKTYFSVELKNGYYVDLNSAVVFKPYSGKPDLGFDWGN